MPKKKNELFRIIKEDIINNTKIYFIIIIIFLVGIFVGVLIVNNTSEKTEIEKYINTYIDEAKNYEDINYLDELRTDVKNNFILTILLWFSGTTIIGMPIALGIVVFRGFCLGYTIASSVYVLGKMKAIIFIFSTILLQNIIFIPAIMILGVSSIKLYKSIIKDRRKENIKISIIKHSVISLLTLIALIISSIIKIEISYRLVLILIRKTPLLNF